MILRLGEPKWRFDLVHLIGKFTDRCTTREPLVRFIQHGHTEIVVYYCPCTRYPKARATSPMYGWRCAVSSGGIGIMKVRGKNDMKKKEAPVQQGQEEQLPKVVGVLPAGIESKFEFYNFGHALEILTQSCKVEWADFLECLRAFSIPIEDIMTAGGNESPIPKRLDDLLYPRGWREIRITGDLLIKLFIALYRRQFVAACAEERRRCSLEQ